MQIRKALLVRQSRSALIASSFQNFPAIGAGHSFAEAMNFLSVQLFRLIGPFHFIPSFLKSEVWVSAFCFVPKIEQAVDLLRCRSGTLSVIGYNLELGITKEIEVDSREDGDIILNARLFGEIINRMPAGSLSLSTDDKLLTIIRGGGAQFTILGMSAEEYPEIPVISEERSFRLPAETLRSMISQTLFAVSQDAATPVLTGTLFEIQNGTRTI